MSQKPSAPRTKRLLAFGIVATLTLLAACSADTTPDPTGLPIFPEAPPPPSLDPDTVALGEILYQTNCASCHGADLQGNPDWMTPNPDGSYPPPPHDNSGHSWHHPDQNLLVLIRDGSDFPQSRMPAFGQTLDDDQIMAILDYLKSHWGPQERAFQWQVTWQQTQQ